MAFFHSKINRNFQIFPQDFDLDQCPGFADYFLVNTNATTQPEVLEIFLKESFQKHNLITDFEIGIYDCTTDRMRYGMSVSTRNNEKSTTTTADWIKTDKYPYYFGIRFPQQES